MYKMILKKVIFLILGLLTLSSWAGQDKELLANQCYELAQAVTSLVSSQYNGTCVEKLSSASLQMEHAAVLIRGGFSPGARKIIDQAVSALQYAELSSCNRYIQISHSKIQAYKLKQLV